MMDVLIVEPNKLPYEKRIPNTLEAKQKIVGGLIEVTYMLNDDKVAIICNEEGKIYGMPLNRDIGHDIIAGTFIIVGNDENEEDFISLSKEQVKKYKERFNEESIVETENKITAIALKKGLMQEQNIN